MVWVRKVVRFTLGPQRAWFRTVTGPSPGVVTGAPLP
jgi:hypothetical protein